MNNQPVQKKNRRVVGIIVILIVILIGLGVYSHDKKGHSEQLVAPNATQTTPTTTGPDSPSKTLLPSPKTISAFTLTDDTGKPFTDDQLKGHWSFLFFGFTHCGDVCPTTLTELNQMYQQLQQTLPADQLPQIVFVSVDPERDTTDVLHNYIKNFNPSFIGATATPENLDVFVKDMGVFYSKAPGGDANTYSVNHSSQLYVFNPDGNWIGILTSPHQAEQLVKNYEEIINSEQQPSA